MTHFLNFEIIDHSRYFQKFACRIDLGIGVGVVDTLDELFDILQI